MTTILRFLEVLSLGAWVGGILFLSVAVAPAAFAILPTREQAGALVGMALTRLHILGYVAGAVFLVSRMARLRGMTGLASLAAAAVILMLLLTVVSQHLVSPRLADLRAHMKAEFGSVDATPQGHALRAEFGRLHGVSALLELAVLLVGVAALFLTVRAPVP